MELSYIYQLGGNNKQRKLFFLCIGRFSKGSYTIFEQLQQQDNIIMKGIRSAQQQLIRKMAAKNIEPFSWPLQSSFDSDSTIAPTKEKEVEAAEKQTAYLENINERVSKLLQVHLFNHIIKDCISSEAIWDLIDQTKLKDSVA
jgi:hypothetical protein